MSYGTSINLHDEVSPAIWRHLSMASPRWRARVHADMGRAGQELCRDYLIGLAQTRHATATKLGGTPTGILGLAAEQINSPEALTANTDSAVISVESPALARVGHDVDIYPIHAKALSIPMNAEAYGHRYFKGAEKRTGAKWIFVKHVHQTQDRTLLPSDEALADAGKAALSQDINDTLAGIGRLN